MASKQKAKPVAIAHLRLDHELAQPPRPLRHVAIDRAREEEEAGARKRIKEINAFLGARENALAQRKLRGSPMAVLIEKASAKGEELTAAQDIELAYFALTGALMIKPRSYERISGSRRRPDWNARTSQAVQQYQAWANHWSARRKTHLDYTLECVIAAVIDQRPIRAIARDLGFQHKKIERAVLCGLRDYAARAGWVDGALAQQWMDAAETVFDRKVAWCV